jgi:hypothetical protein
VSGRSLALPHSVTISLAFLPHHLSPNSPHLSLGSLPSMSPKDTSPPIGVVQVSQPYDGQTVHDRDTSPPPTGSLTDQPSPQNPPSHWPQYTKYSCAVAHTQGPRRFMEDSHALVAPFNQVHGQGFFAVFDGHAGKHAAEWCGQHFHEVRSLLTMRRHRRADLTVGCDRAPTRYRSSISRRQ